MKKKNLIAIFVLLLTISLSFCLTACGKTHGAKNTWSYNDEYHWHECKACDEEFDKEKHNFINTLTSKKCETCGAEIEYSNEENYSIWAIGRDYAKNYNSEYTYSYQVKNYENNKETFESSEIEAKKDNSYYYEYKEILVDENNAKVEDYVENRVIKTVLDNEILKGKYVKEVKNEKGNSREGKFVKPDYANSLIEYSPSELIENYGIGNGDNYLDFYNNFNQLLISFYNENLISLNILTTRNLDGSVSLLVGFSYVKENSNYSSVEGYEKSIYEEKYNYIVKDEKLISIDENFKVNNIFEDTTNNVVTIEQSKTLINYSFDEEYFNSLSIETEITKNEYNARVTFVVNGVKLFDKGVAPVGETYSNIVAKNYLYDLSYFIIAVEDAEFDKNLFEIYTNSEMTEEFTSVKVLNDEDFTLYVKLTPPESKALVLSVDTNRNEVILVHVANLNDKFWFSFLNNYNVISVDGEDASNLDGFICAENKVYLVRC